MPDEAVSHLTAGDRYSGDCTIWSATRSKVGVAGTRTHLRASDFAGIDRQGLARSHREEDHDVFACLLIRVECASVKGPTHGVPGRVDAIVLLFSRCPLRERRRIGERHHAWDLVAFRNNRLKVLAL